VKFLQIFLNFLCYLGHFPEKNKLLNGILFGHTDFIDGYLLDKNCARNVMIAVSTVECILFLLHQYAEKNLETILL